LRGRGNPFQTHFGLLDEREGGVWLIAVVGSMTEALFNDLAFKHPMESRVQILGSIFE